MVLSFAKLIKNTTKDTWKWLCKC